MFWPLVHCIVSGDNKVFVWCFDPLYTVECLGIIKYLFDVLTPCTLTRQCTRGQNSKQILYYPQTHYSVQGSKHQTNTLLSPDTLQCTRGQNIKHILYYPQTLYSVQGVKTSNKYFIIPRHSTVYKGSKHQTNTLLSLDVLTLVHCIVSGDNKVFV
jgi:hypothetical protein